MKQHIVPGLITVGCVLFALTVFEMGIKPKIQAHLAKV